MESGDAGFGDLKKGEVNEMRMALRDPKADRDGAHKRETLKKVIAYMTMGIDMSRLFSDMIIVSVSPFVAHLMLSGNRDSRYCRDEDGLSISLQLCGNE